MPTRSAARAARLARLNISALLPSELLGCIASFVSAKALCRLACTDSLWRAAVDAAAECRVRAYLQTTLRLRASPCWLRSLAQIERLTAAVGPRPVRGWRSEWHALKMAAAQLRAEEEGRVWDAEWHATEYADDGPQCMARQMELGEFQQLVHAPELHGCWDDEAARYISCTGGGEESRVLRAAFRNLEVKYAALQHASLSAYSSAACVIAQQGLAPPPPVYATLTGPPDEGLAQFDDAWLGLPDLAVGAEFRAAGSARLADARYFPDDLGMYYGDVIPTGPQMDDYEIEWKLVDSDVVRFVSRPADRHGYHALLQDLVDHGSDGSCDASWSVPHDSLVRLEAISEAGEWTVRGLRVRRRLYTVSISFG